MTVVKLPQELAPTLVARVTSLPVEVALTQAPRSAGKFPSWPMTASSETVRTSGCSQKFPTTHCRHVRFEPPAGKSMTTLRLKRARRPG